MMGYLRAGTQIYGWDLRTIGDPQARVAKPTLLHNMA